MKITFTAAVLSLSLLAGVSASLLVFPDVTIARTAHATVRVTHAVLAPTLNHNPRHFARLRVNAGVQHLGHSVTVRSQPSGVRFALRTGANVGTARSGLTYVAHRYAASSTHHCPGMSASSMTTSGTTGK